MNATIVINLLIFSGRQTQTATAEKSHSNATCWLCVISSEPFEGAFDNTYKGRTTVWFLKNIKIH